MRRECGFVLHVVLVEPEIPANTGNIARTCATTGSVLHLIRPLGFDISDKAVKRAGLDYWEYATLRIHDSFDAFLAAEKPNPKRMFAMTTKGSSIFSSLSFRPGDWFVFGSEGSGLPDEIRAQFPSEQRIRLPMRPDNRSLNLSNAVAVTVFEAWRQQGYAGGV